MHSDALVNQSIVMQKRPAALRSLLRTKLDQFLPALLRGFITPK